MIFCLNYTYPDSCGLLIVCLNSLWQVILLHPFPGQLVTMLRLLYYVPITHGSLCFPSSDICGFDIRTLHTIDFCLCASLCIKSSAGCSLLWNILYCNFPQAVFHSLFDKDKYGLVEQPVIKQIKSRQQPLSLVHFSICFNVICMEFE